MANLVDFIKPISVGEASKQVLGTLTAGIFTPNGLGEYAGKPCFQKEQTKKWYFKFNLQRHPNDFDNYFRNSWIVFNWILEMALAIIELPLSYFNCCSFLKTLQLKGIPFKKLLHKIKEIPKIHRKILS